MSGDDALDGDGYDPSVELPELMAAQAELARHHVDQAQAIYNQIISEDPDPPGQAFAGKAITDLLLLPGAPAMSDLLVGQLNATHALDANTLIYAEEGLLYWVVRGVPWEDQGSYKGVNSLIAARLPWSQARLSGVQEFFEGITQSLNLATADLVVLADSMASIQADIERALADDYFDAIYIPGLTFHSEQLDLFLGRSELHLLSAAVSTARAGLYFMSAYAYDFSLDDVLGAQAASRLDPQPDWGFEDYAHAFLDSRLLRHVDSPERLLRAREALDAGLTSVSDAIREGLENHQQTSIRWEQGDRAYADTLLEFLEALQGSLFGPVMLPDSTPETTLDLSSFFEGGRTLNTSIDWFERVELNLTVSHQDEDGEWVEEAQTEWRVTDEAAQAFFIDGVFSPPFDADDEPPEFGAASRSGGEFFEAIFGSLLDRISEAFY